jgi:hypothetical protein
MKARYVIPVLVVTTLASVGSAEAQTVVIEDDAPPVWAPAVPAVVPSPVVTPGVVVVRRRPIVAAAPVVVAPRPTPLVTTETVVIRPGYCPYGYGYC